MVCRPHLAAQVFLLTACLEIESASASTDKLMQTYRNLRRTLRSSACSLEDAN